jgi:hypothetical protein
MQASFTDLVGTSVASPHCFGTDELADLTPALASEVGLQAHTAGGPRFCSHIADTQDTVYATQADLSHQASETAISRPGTLCCL